MAATAVGARELYEQQARQREIVTLRTKAAKLGLALVESPA
jgi:hypothetical protein